MRQLQTFSPCFRKIIRNPTNRNRRGDGLQFAVIALHYNKESVSGARRNTNQGLPRSLCSAITPAGDQDYITLPMCRIFFSF